VTIGDEKIRIIELTLGESESSSALYIPSRKVLVAGDSVFNKVHLWLAEKHIEGWLENIRKLQDAGDIELVLLGHGLPANSTVIKENIRYIEAFVRAIKRSKTKDEAFEKIKNLYPKYRLGIIAQISTDASFK
jgi:glyoxylase-like metal-dependent hydrolase (beta-lactamase superfamily II)